MPNASGAYLFVNSDSGDTSASSSVFYCCSDSTYAQSLCNLFTREYSTKARTLRFHFRPKATISLEDRVLLDEELQRLEVYSEPDRTAYNPEPSKKLHERAMFAVQATDWENSLRHHTTAKPTSADGAKRPGSPSDQAQLALSALLYAVERHRLMFLYWATARRRNPLVSHRRTGAIEELDKDGFRGWEAMVADIDADGAFLWTHQEVLDRYAQQAIGLFGPGDGMPPGELDADGRHVPLNGGTYPYWTIDDGATGCLEETSDAILDACCALAEAGSGSGALELVKNASAAARPESHARWYTNIVVKWPYLSMVDALVARIKRMRVELAIPASAENAPEGAPATVTPDPQSVADLVVLFMIARDLVRVGLEYPDSVPDADHKAWVNEITAHADLILKRPGFDRIRTLMDSPMILEMDVPDRFGILMSTALMAHPTLVIKAGTSADTQTAVEKAMRACQEMSSPHVRAHMSRLANVMVVSCRCPTGTAVKDFAEPERFLQMLGRYWRLASDLVQLQSSSEVGFTPHPLLHLIENIHDRLRACFGRLRHLNDADEAECACDQLLGTLKEGEIDDFAAVPEWTSGELQKVELFIARARLKSGGQEYPLTAPEEFFVKQCEQLISEHSRRVKGAWKQLLANADAQAAARKASEAAADSRSQMASAASVVGRAVPPPGESGHETHPFVTRTALTADHETILTILAKTPTKCRTVVNVAGTGPIRDRETVGRLLRELARFGLVDRPHGVKKGYAITTGGLVRINTPSAVT